VGAAKERGARTDEVERIRAPIYTVWGGNNHLEIPESTPMAADTVVRASIAPESESREADLWAPPGGDWREGTPGWRKGPTPQRHKARARCGGGGWADGSRLCWAKLRQAAQLAFLFFSFCFFSFLFLIPNLNFNLDSNFCGSSVTNFICALKVLSLRVFIKYIIISLYPFSFFPFYFQT
jgi:hypothetical protein